MWLSLQGKEPRAGGEMGWGGRKAKSLLIGSWLGSKLLKSTRKQPPKKTPYNLTSSSTYLESCFLTLSFVVFSLWC